MSSAIFTAIHWDDRPVERSVLAASNRCMEHRCPDGSWFWSDGAVGMAQADLATLPEDEPGVAITMGPLRIVADCRIDNRDEIVNALPASYRPDNSTDAAIILASYAAWGERCLDKLIGDFAFAIWNTRERRLFAARDLSGSRRLFFYSDRRRLILASDRTQILQDPTVPMEVDEDQLLDYFTPAYQWTSGWDQGLFRNFQVLHAGYALRAEQGHVAVHRFWDWRDHTPSDRPEQQVLEEYLHTLEEAVRCRLRSRVRPVAMELSGGLDSTAVVALAARMNSDHELHTFSLVFDRFADPAERQRIDAMIERFGLSAHLIVSDDNYTPDFLLPHWHPEIVTGPHELLGNAAEREEYTAIQDAGCRVVLTGLMGDSLNEGCDRVYYDLLRRGQMGEVLRCLRLDWQRNRKTTVGAFLYYGLMPFAPWPLLRPALVWQELRQGLYSSELPAFFPAPLQKRIRERDRVLRVQKTVELGVRSPAVRYTLEEVMRPMIASTQPAERPLEFRHPFYDRRLVEMVLSMPQEQKWNHEADTYKAAERLHHRRALRCIMPDVVLEQKQGMDFSGAVKHGLQPDEMQRWLEQKPTIRIVERGYVTPEVFARTIAHPGRDYSYLITLLTVEGCLRAIAPNGIFKALIPPRQSTNNAINNILHSSDLLQQEIVA